MSETKKPGLPMPTILRPPLKTTTSEGATQAPPPIPPSAGERKPEAVPPPVEEPILPSPREAQAVLHGKKRVVKKFRSRAIVHGNRYVRIDVWVTPEEKEDFQLLCFAKGLSESSLGRVEIQELIRRNRALIDKIKQATKPLQDSA